MRKKAFCLVLSKWYVKFVAYEKKKTERGKHVCLKKKAIREKTDLECKEKICNALCVLCPVSTLMVVRREDMYVMNGVYAQVVEKKPEVM